MSDNFGKKTIRLIEATFSVVLSRYGHQTSELSNIRKSGYEYLSVSYCNRCCVLKYGAIVHEGVQFKLEKVYGKDYFQVSIVKVPGHGKPYTPWNDVALIDYSGNEVVKTRREIEHNLLCAKYQNLL